MKYIVLLSILMISVTSTLANDRHTDDVFTSAVFLYWCTYKKIPTSEADISKVTDVLISDPEITMDLNDWLGAMSYEINNDALTIVKISKVMTAGEYQSTHTFKLTTNCESFKKVK